ncbi:MAG TPA: NHL repeat-containing protein [Solirubrobacter sp.]|nr:NHL repeat-containing protein [Solirubrobacter sp.]
MFRPSARALAGAVMLTLLGAPAAVAAPGDLSTVAGGPGAGPATGLGLVPAGLAAAGDRLLVSDAQNGTLRAVSLTTGAATTLAGIGAAGLGADGRLATLTALPGAGNSFVGPQQVAVAPDGDVLVAVGGGSTVRRIDAVTGIMSIVAGNGSYSAAGAGDGQPATAVSLGAPYGVAVAADGAVVISDTGSGRVRRVDPATGTISTLAAGLASPYHLAFAPDGGLLVAEYGGHRLRRIAPNGTVTTVAGTGVAASTGDGGPATAAALNRPWGVAVLADGSIAVAENAGRRIRLIAPGGEIRALDAGPLDAPAGLAATANRLFVADGGTTRQVRSVDLGNETLDTVAGNGTTSFSGEDAPAATAQLSSPWGVTVAPDGRIAIADTTNFRVRAIDPATGRIRTLAGSGVSCPSVTDTTCVGGVPAREAKLVRPWDVAVAGDGTVYLLESNAAISRLSRVDPATGTITPVAGAAPGYAGDGGPAAAARFGEAQGVAVTSTAVYVADTGNARVRRIDLASGTIETVAGTGVAGLSGDGGSAAAAQLASPTDVAVTAAGELLIADAGNRRVRRVDAAGRIETVAAGFASVRGVAAGPDGAIAVADSTGHAVYAIAAGGAPVRVAGTGAGGYDGETGGRLSGPASVAFERSGDLIVADTANNRVRRIENPLAVSGDTTVGGSVPATLALTLGAPASFGAFTPGVAREYTAATTATVLSTAGDAALSVSDPGRLANGRFTLAQPLRVEIAPAAWDGPVANAPAAITFHQAIGAGEALRTGSYARTLTFTLATTNP